MVLDFSLLRWYSGLLVVCVAWTTGQAHGQAETAVSSRWTLARDGTSVLDQQSDLVWARCVLGMSWNGQACVGEAQRLTRSQALAAAAALAQSDGQGWRLPHVKELQRLIRRASPGRGVDTMLFPQAPVDWHWAGSASLDSGGGNIYNYGNVMAGRQGPSLNHRSGWSVHLGTGEANGETPRQSALPVRLVRPQSN